jgi:sugar/nucleoside kinase (ribokinase family)
MDIVGLGTVAMDVILELDVLPGKDEFAVIERRSYLPGGSGTNAIVQAARLGASCAFIAQVGDDQLGDEIVQSLESEGVSTAAMRRKVGGISLHTMVFVAADGAKFIVLDMGDAFLALPAAAADGSLIGSAKVFYTDLLPGAAGLAALKAAKAAGAATVFNMQVGLQQMTGFGVSEAVIAEALRYVDVFAPCREAFAALTGTQDAAAGAAKLADAVHGLLLLTRGQEGSVAFAPSGLVARVPAFEVEAVDTTGAGDSYIGAFMVARFLEGYPDAEAMRYATACAALTCTGLGARSSPNAAAAAAFLASRGPAPTGAGMP